ncbi:MAG: hypothetical protein K2J25_05760 [Oscillospiraceae bacterium]|nr:hypothetical protein [Oscillospiraceae bacterium]MDE6657659.1 hypothetical protein [Oscillospiraceae bacterium]MDE6777431.1 hypothetical protein [Oscillospiraceae bacterium]
MNEEFGELLEATGLDTPEIQLIFNGTVKNLNVTINHFEEKVEEETE